MNGSVAHQQSYNVGKLVNNHASTKLSGNRRYNHGTTVDVIGKKQQHHHQSIATSDSIESASTFSADNFNRLASSIHSFSTVGSIQSAQGYKSTSSGFSSSRMRGAAVTAGELSKQGAVESYIERVFEVES